MCGCACACRDKCRPVLLSIDSLTHSTLLVIWIQGFGSPQQVPFGGMYNQSECCPSFQNVAAPSMMRVVWKAHAFVLVVLQ